MHLLMLDKMPIYKNTIKFTEDASNISPYIISKSDSEITPLLPLYAPRILKTIFNC